MLKFNCKSVGKILVVCQKPLPVIYAILIDASQNCSQYFQDFIKIYQRTTLGILHTLHAYPEATSVSLRNLHSQL